MDFFFSFFYHVSQQGKVYQRAWWAPIWVKREMEVRPWALIAPSHKVCPKSAALSVVLGRAHVPLTSAATVHNIPDEPGARQCRFTLCLQSNKLVQLAATDHR